MANRLTTFMSGCQSRFQQVLLFTLPVSSIEFLDCVRIFNCQRHNEPLSSGALLSAGRRPEAWNILNNRDDHSFEVPSTARTAGYPRKIGVRPH